jgi:hypothetical protein
VLAGNHEIELQPDGRIFTAYNTRYPQSQNPDSFKFDTSAVPASVNGSDNNLYSAAVVPGIATVVSVHKSLESLHAQRVESRSLIMCACPTDQLAGKTQFGTRRV